MTPMEDLIPPTRLAILMERLREQGYKVRLDRDAVSVVEPLTGPTDMMHASVKLKPPIEEDTAFRSVCCLLGSMGVEVPGLVMTIVWDGS